MKIIVKPDSDGYRARLEGVVGVWGTGKSAYAAIGNLMMAHQALFGVEIELRDHDEDCEKARRLCNTLFGCGNDLSSESSRWLSQHTASCVGCRAQYESGMALMQKGASAKS